jgi:hypothetical protein
MVAQVRYSMVRQLRGRVTLCAVCTVPKKARSVGFLVEPQNQGRWFVSALTSKPLRWFVSGFTSKPLRRFVSDLASKPMAMVFSNLASKSVATVSPNLASKPVVDFLVEPQNQGSGGFSGFGLKTGSYGLVIWASKSLR